MAAPVAALTTYRDPAGINYLDQLNTTFPMHPRDVHPQLIKLSPDTGKLGTVFRMGLAKGEDVTHPFEFQHVWQRDRPRTVTIGAQVLVGATSATLQAGHGQRVTNGMILTNARTGENVQISHDRATAFPSTDVIGFGSDGRSVGSVPAQQMEVGDVLLVGPPVRTEVSVDPDPIAYKPDWVYQYLTEMSLATGATMRMMNSIQYAGWSWKHEQAETAEEYKRLFDWNILFSQLSQRTAAVDSSNITTSQGFFEVTKTNVDHLQAVPDWWALQKILYPHVRYGRGGIFKSGGGTGLKHVFMSPAWAQLLQTYSSTMIRLNNPEMNTDEESGMKYGWTVSRLAVHGVELVCHVVHWWAEEYVGGAFNLPNLFMVVDRNHVGLRYGKNRRMTFLPNRQDRNVMNELAVWYSDAAPVWELEASQGIVTAPLV